jgi:phosphatidylglycerophosphate synthase
MSAPDLLTAARIPLALGFLLANSAGMRLVVLGAAAASDVIDGIWARRIGGSRVGVVLDPVCDKLFMLAAFGFVWTSGALAWYEIAGVLLRDLVAGLAFLVTVTLRRPTALPARAGGKLVTVVQVLVLVAFLMESSLLRPAAWLTAAVSIYAIYDYTREAMRR